MTTIKMIFCKGTGKIVYKRLSWKLSLKAIREANK